MWQSEVGTEGIAPMLFFKDTGTDEGKAGKLTPDEYREQARTMRCYRNGHGLFVPAANIKRSIRFGATMAVLKVGRKGADQYLNPLMFIDPMEVLLHKDEPDFIDERMGRIPPGPKGARVMLYRPGVHEGWRLDFTIKVFDDVLAPKIVRQALETAGYMVGLCNGRPEFGRFKIVKWKESKIKNVA